MRKDYEEAIDVLQAAQAYADELRPRPGESVSAARMDRWVTAKQVVDLLQAEVNRLAQGLAGNK